MKSINKLIQKIKGSGNGGFLLAILAFVLIAFLIITIAGLVGLALIYGLNLMGMGIPYSPSAIFGAAIVVFLLRSTTTTSSK